MPKILPTVLCVLVFLLVAGLWPGLSQAAHTSAHTRAPANLRGRILLQVEDYGEAWYVEPIDGLRYYLGRPQDAFDIMRGLGLGATHANIEKIPSALHENSSLAFAQRFAGRILIDVDQLGEAWYINPENLQGYYLGHPEDAFNIMRSTGLGAATRSIQRISPNVQITGIYYDGFWPREADEFVDIHNFGRMAQDMTSWTLTDEAESEFTFPSVSLNRNENVRVYTDTGDYQFDYNWPIWNNDGDTAFLRAETGALVDSYNYY